MNLLEEYKKKLVSADQAVQLVKSNSRISVGSVGAPTLEIDKALARKKDSLQNVYITCSSMMHYSEAIKSDPQQEHFIMNDFSFSVAERKMQADGLVYHIPEVLHEIPRIYKQTPPDIVFAAATPMDEKGYFNMSISGVSISTQMELAKHIVLEIHPTLPHVYGEGQYIHISQVDYVVEVANSQLPLCLPEIATTEDEKKIAKYIMQYIEDGACLQLGVGGTPNYVGKMIAESDIQDIGVHTELLCDAYVDMFETGKITGRRKTLDRGLSIATFVLGTKKLYDFTDHNPLIQIKPVEYTNNPCLIQQNDKVISVCACLHVDILGQVSAESIGRKQVSGTGGQMDFHYASYHSKGGKGFICLQSARWDKKTEKFISNIVPAHVPGTVVTTPSSIVNYIVTENGIVQLKGLSTWERAEALISIAHPSCQDELVAACQEANIWRRSNKR